MKIINKYFIKQLTAIFLILLLVLSGLTWFLQLMTTMKTIIHYGVNLSNFIKLTFLIIPFMVSIIIPFITFISIIYTYNKLITNNEIIVLTSSGLSKKELSKPALIFVSVITLVHLILTVYISPLCLFKFYETQWNLRYGLAHLKIEESSFNKITNGLIVYVDKVSDRDFLNIMLSDTRNSKTQITIFSEKGKLVQVNNNMSLIMSNGMLQIRNKYLTVGSFQNFDMSLNLGDDKKKNSMRTRAMSTKTLFKNMFVKNNPNVLTELATRLFMPFMNLILSLFTLFVLLNSPLLRRRISFAPLISIVGMVILMTSFMTSTNLINNFFHFIVLFIIQLVIIVSLLLNILKK